MVHGTLARLVGFPGEALLVFGLAADVFLLGGIALRLAPGGGLVSPRQLRSQLGDGLLLPLGLVVSPSVGGFGLVDGCLVLGQQRGILRGAALVAEDGAGR